MSFLVGIVGKEFGPTKKKSKAKKLPIIGTMLLPLTLATGT